MQAIRVRELGAPETMRLESVADLLPKPGELLVQIKAAGVNPVDAYIQAGRQGYSAVLPYTPGMDGAGIVTAVGGGVSGFKNGDRVYLAGSISGTYAGAALAREAHVHPLPEPVSFSQGAALGVPYATAHRALFQRGQAQPGETLLVHGGSGGVGVAALQWGKAAGLLVIATAGTETGRRRMLDEGADYALDHGDEGHWEQIREITAGKGVNVILEMLANVNLGKDLSCLGKRGRVVVIGSRGTVEVNPRDLMARDGDIRGMVLFNAPENELETAHRAIGLGLKHGALHPVIREEVPLAHAALAHHAVLEQKGFGKIVLIP